MIAAVIVVVEGPSAAGKTTWCRRHYPDQLVEEYTPTGAEPGDHDPLAQGRYWTDVNSGRWCAAVAEEELSGLAVCDSDPLKLHYSWCLAAVGAGTVGRWHAELAAVRDAMAREGLGFADLAGKGRRPDRHGEEGPCRTGRRGLLPLVRAIGCACRRWRGR